MAYNTAAERHDKQAKHEGSFSLENRLRMYMRDNFGDKQQAFIMMQSAGVKAVASILVTVARDYDAEIGEYHDNSYYEELAYKVINEYFADLGKNDQAGKDKGHRLGESWGTVTNTLSNFRY